MDLLIHNALDYPGTTGNNLASRATESYVISLMFVANSYAQDDETAIEIVTK